MSTTANMLPRLAERGLIKSIPCKLLQCDLLAEVSLLQQSWRSGGELGVLLQHLSGSGGAAELHLQLQALASTTEIHLGTDDRLEGNLVLALKRSCML